MMMFAAKRIRHPKGGAERQGWIRESTSRYKGKPWRGGQAVRLVLVSPPFCGCDCMTTFQTREDVDIVAQSPQMEIEIR